MYDANRSIYDQLPKQFVCTKKGTSYVTATDTIIINSTNTAFGIVADDPMEGALGVLGVYEVNMYVDGNAYFGWVGLAVFNQPFHHG